MKVLETFKTFRKGVSFSFFYLLLFTSLATAAGMVLITSRESVSRYTDITQQTVNEYTTLLNLKHEAVETQMAMLRLIFNTEPGDVQYELEFMDTVRTRYDRSWNELSSLSAQSAVKPAFDSLAKYRRINEAARELVLYHSLQGPSSQGKAIHLYYSVQKPAYDAYQQRLEVMSQQMSDMSRQGLRETGVMVRSSSREVNWLLFFSFLIMIAGGMLITYHHRQFVRVQEQLHSERSERHIEITRQTLAVQEKERNTIGRELHDNVNQMLTVVKLKLAIAAENREKASALIPSCSKHLCEAIEEIRSLSKNLVTPITNQICLRASIQELISTVKPLIPYQHVFLDQSEYRDGCVNVDVKLAIYRILQEQLNNIIKHAQATEVGVTLKVSGENLMLQVQDNGCGFDPTSVRHGVGINNILTRAEAYKGEAIFETSPGRGCLLQVFFPLSTPKKTLRYNLTSRWAALS